MSSRTNINASKSRGYEIVNKFTVRTDDKSPLKIVISIFFNPDSIGKGGESQSDHATQNLEKVPMFAQK